MKKRFAKTLSTRFASIEINVTTFTDPNMALEVAEANPPDILFIDYRLQDITGDEVASKMAAEIPKYLITGDNFLKIDYSFKAILIKPYQPEEIQQVLDAFLKAAS